jgi:hypothetical protein
MRRRRVLELAAIMIAEVIGGVRVREIERKDHRTAGSG